MIESPAAVMAALDAIGYSGWASAEVGGGDAERLTAINAWMDEMTLQKYDNGELN